jgi:hypothetical protein
MLTPEMNTLTPVELANPAIISVADITCFKPTETIPSAGTCIWSSRITPARVIVAVASKEFVLVRMISVTIPVVAAGIVYSVADAVPSAALAYLVAVLAIKILPLLT